MMRVVSNLATRIWLLAWLSWSKPVLSNKTCEDIDETAYLQVKRSACDKRSVIVDTDMDIDDMMALVYLLTEQSIDVLAITVTSDGWSAQYAGVNNAMRLTQKYGKEHIPVAYMEGYLGQTQLNDEYPNQLPPYSLLNGTDTFLTNWLPTPTNHKPPAWESAPQLISRVLKEADGLVDVLALGPWTNLADALHRDSEIFRTKVGTIYVSGGYINGEVFTADKPKKMIQEILDQRSAHQKTASFPYKWHPVGAGWNFFSDPISASQVFSSGVELVMLTSNAEAIPVNETDSQYIPASCNAEQRDYLSTMYTKFAPANGQTFSEVFYWDPSTAVLMKELQGSCGKGAADLCTKWRSRKLKVNLEPGGTFSWTELSSFGTQVRVCLEANATIFKEVFFSSGCDLQYVNGLARTSTSP